MKVDSGRYSFAGRFAFLIPIALALAAGCGCSVVVALRRYLAGDRYYSFIISAGTKKARHILSA